jgi:hypothetical protein
MAWYDTKTCALCAKTIGKRYFWQDKPRLVGAEGDVRDCAYVPEDKVPALLATHVLVCHACYLHRFGEVKALAGKARQGAPATEG